MCYYSFTNHPMGELLFGVGLNFVSALRMGSLLCRLILKTFNCNEKYLLSALKTSYTSNQEG